MIKETIKLTDGSVKEIELKFLGLRKSKQIKSKYININRITPEGATGIKSMEGTFDYEGLSLEVLEYVIPKEINLDNVDPEDGDRIYNKYYARIFNPNADKQEKK